MWVGGTRAHFDRSTALYGPRQWCSGLSSWVPKQVCKHRPQLSLLAQVLEETGIVLDPASVFLAQATSSVFHDIGKHYVTVSIRKVVVQSWIGWYHGSLART